MDNKNTPPIRPEEEVAQISHSNEIENISMSSDANKNSKPFRSKTRTNDWVQDNELLIETARLLRETANLYAGEELVYEQGNGSYNRYTLSDKNVRGYQESTSSYEGKMADTGYSFTTSNVRNATSGRLLLCLLLLSHRPLLIESRRIIFSNLGMFLKLAPLDHTRTFLFPITKRHVRIILHLSNNLGKNLHELRN